MSSLRGSNLIVALIAILGVIAVAGYLSGRGLQLTSFTTDGSQDKRLHPRREAKAAQTLARSHRRIVPIIGQTPIALVIDGKSSASLTGETMQTSLSSVTIISKHDTRAGWAVADILHAHGVEQAKEVIFINNAGKQWSASWDQVADSQHRLILSYSRRGVPLLLSGPAVEGSLPPPPEARALLHANPTLVLFPGVAKIEVRS
jgi:hypothetical protein